MKTTVEIPDALLDEARKFAARHGTTVRVLIIEGLRKTVAERNRGKAFRLRRASVEGNGLQPGIEDASWARVRAMAYERQGG